MGVQLLTYEEIDVLREQHRDVEDAIFWALSARGTRRIEEQRIQSSRIERAKESLLGQSAKGRRLNEKVNTATVWAVDKVAQALGLHYRDAEYRDRQVSLRVVGYLRAIEEREGRR